MLGVLPRLGHEADVVLHNAVLRSFCGKALWAQAPSVLGTSEQPYMCSISVFALCPPEDYG